MTVNRDATSVIKETLSAIATDEVASLVSDALHAAWTGQRIEDEKLRAELGALAEAEAGL